MLLEYTIGTIIGNISTALVLALVYFNFLLFEDYFRVIIWSVLFSQALRGAKEKICRILNDLSNAQDVQRNGLLYSICNKFWPYLMQGNDQKKRIQELILDNGIFIFAMIGAVSIYVRMFSWLSFLQVVIGILAILAATLYVLDRRIFHYRYFISDEVLVSALLLVGCCIVGCFVLLFLGTESYMEGNRAAMHITSWIQNNVVNDERTRNLWGEQVQNGKAMIASGLREIEGQYNTTMWFAPLKALVYSYYDASDDKSTVTAASDVMNVTTVARIIDFPANLTWTSVFTLAYSKFNLTSTDVTDWTAKGFEISSMAFGSVFQILFFVITFTIAFISIGIKAVFFVTSLFYLLCTTWDPIQRFASDITSNTPDQPKAQALANPLREAIEGVFFLPLKISSLHAIVTLVSLSMMANDFVYLGTLITFFISIVPIIPAYLVCIPWVIALWSSTSFFKALLLFVIHYVAFSWIDQVLYQKSLTAINPYVSALSVVFGVYVFGLEGVVFGPLLVWGVQYAYSVGIKGDPYFSDTMKVFSGFNDNIVRRCSIDITSSNATEVTLIVPCVDSDTREQSIRFVVDKNGTYEDMLGEIRQLLKVQRVQGLYDTKNVLILSAKHIKQHEIIRVEVEKKRNKTKNSSRKPTGKMSDAMSSTKRRRRASCDCYTFRTYSLPNPQPPLPRTNSHSLNEPKSRNMHLPPSIQVNDPRFQENCKKSFLTSFMGIQKRLSMSSSPSHSVVRSDQDEELANASTKSQASDEAEFEPVTHDDSPAYIDDKDETHKKNNKSQSDIIDTFHAITDSTEQHDNRSTDSANDNDEYPTEEVINTERKSESTADNAHPTRNPDLNEFINSNESITEVAPTADLKAVQVGYLVQEEMSRVPTTKEDQKNSSGKEDVGRESSQVALQPVHILR
ncbi:hypothetical protein THRCLA_02094 [Thraustotheca clavata]|uniref:Transmembrane protein n=1 Tax=Thraustotheca clavata TaxID=74557 RepID=A0A1W0A708_9STRA|nr:hypothetical protein THRCLA_02094 [Thraustotheca clavata]